MKCRFHGLRQEVQGLFEKKHNGVAWFRCRYFGQGGYRSAERLPRSHAQSMLRCGVSRLSGLIGVARCQRSRVCRADSCVKTEHIGAWLQWKAPSRISSTRPRSELYGRHDWPAPSLSQRWCIRFTCCSSAISSTAAAAITGYAQDQERPMAVTVGR